LEATEKEVVLGVQQHRGCRVLQKKVNTKENKTKPEQPENQKKKETTTQPKT